MAKNYTAKGVRWDLSELYSGLNDPKIKKDQAKIERLVVAFTKNYKGKIKNNSASLDLLYKSIIDYEKIFFNLAPLEAYAFYKFSQDARDAKTKKLYQESTELYSQVVSDLVWFEIEWMAKPQKKLQSIINNPKFAKYRHYLKKLLDHKPYTLSEKEEAILAQKAQSSGLALTRLYQEVTSSEEFKLTINGKTKTLNSSQLASHLKDNPDRTIRKKAAAAYTKGYKANKNIYVFDLNTLLLDKKITDSLRGYKYPEQETLIDYEINAKMLDSMVNVVTSSYNLVKDYYQTKAKLIKTPKLYEWDRYSQPYPQKIKNYTWEEAKDIVLEAFVDFSPQFAQIAQLFFANNWIDAETRIGKRGGGYCSYTTPDHHPYILINFTGKIDDVFTLAHELGHGIHNYLAKKNSLLEYHSSTAVAEIASVFAETLVFDKIYKETKDKELKINLLATRIQEIFAVVSRQTAFHLFEQDIHQHRRQKGELSEQDLDNYYQKRLQAMFGNSLTLTDQHKSWWIPISYIFNYNFYSFTYSFGLLLSLAIFTQYKKNKSTFVKNYLKALAAGGSKSPTEITKMIGADISKKSFWNQGIEVIKDHIDEFTSLTQSV